MTALPVRHLFYNMRIISYDFSDRYLSGSGLKSEHCCPLSDPVSARIT